MITVFHGFFEFFNIYYFLPWTLGFVSLLSCNRGSVQRHRLGHGLVTVSRLKWFLFYNLFINYYPSKFIYILFIIYLALNFKIYFDFIVYYYGSKLGWVI